MLVLEDVTNDQDFSMLSNFVGLLYTIPNYPFAD